jgi:invasion protein IalB
MITRAFCLLLVSVTLACPAAAQTHKPATPAKPAAPAGPKQIGQFEDWTAATNQEAGSTACYAFTRVQSSVPKVASRGQVILTVTERASGRDTVAISAGFTFAPNAAVTVQVDQTGLEFYTYQTNAFARDGKAAVAAFDKGSRAIARLPGPKDTQVTDTFSLKGFTAAYGAIVKACPAK